MRLDASEGHDHPHEGAKYGSVAEKLVHVAGRGAAAALQGGKVTVDVIGKLWNLPNTIPGLAVGGVGHALGEIGNALGFYTPEPTIEFAHNALEFRNNLLMFGGGALTLGNSISYGSKAYQHAGHEQIHTYQGEVLGPLYVPAHALGMSASVLSYPVPSLRRRDLFHGRLNIMEGSPFSDKLYGE